MTRWFYALDLQDDPALIDEYERWHQADRIWPDILQSLRAAGIEAAEIFRTGTRLVLVMEVSAEFDPTVIPATRGRRERKHHGRRR